MRINKSKAFNVAVSVLVAILLWLYVDNVDQTLATTAVANIPIEFVGESDVLAARGLMMTATKNSVVTLELQGQRNVIYNLRKEDIRVQVDLSSITSAGVHSIVYQVFYPDSVSQSSVTIKSASISMVTVEIGPLYSKSVPITGVLEGSVAEGYFAGELSFDRETIQVSGREEDVLQVSQARVTLTVEEAKETVTKVVKAELIGYDGEVLSGLDLRMDDENVTVTLPVEITKELPLRIDFIEGPGSTTDVITYKIEPKSITVSGSAESLESLQYIRLATIDLTQVMGSESQVMQIPLPADSENLSGIDEATVTIIFNDVDTKTFSVSNIGTTGVADGYTAEVISQSIMVTVRGPAEELEALEAGNIRLVADLSEIGQAVGSYTVSAKVYVDGYENTGAIGTYEVAVKIKRR